MLSFQCLAVFFRGVMYFTNFFIIYPEKPFVVFSGSFFVSIIFDKIAYIILSYCIYKCNLHRMLVVEIFVGLQYILDN